MNAQIRYQIKKLKDYLDIKTEMVNHQEIIRDVVSGVERSWIYYLMLLMAGLIALLGLLTNSVAVVIGAMLISPLMGPIISSGLAFTIGDLMLARRAFRTITVSVVLTVMVTALVTLISPLKEPTAEILARVRPNIYDLFVAVLSGIVGAVALCTKRNYLITATGVAVATAVIPPLSVAGYGLGTGQLMLGMGGFLLFFTNFVAIVLTSDLVFFIMGFRTSHVETIQYSQRTRLLVIGALLALISIPLVYTLVVDLQKVNSKKRIERVLKKHLNREQASRMTGYTYRQDLGKLLVRATVNTVSYIGKETEKLAESELQQGFKSPVDLNLEQIIVASEQIPKNNDPVPEEETTAEISAKAGKLVVRAERALAAAMDPFPVEDTRLSFSDGRQKLQVTATLHRDWPVGSDELLLLTRQMEQALELPLTLTLKSAPLLPPLNISDDGNLTLESSAALAVIRQLPDSMESYRYLLEGSDRNSRQQLAAIQNHLIQTLKVPETALTVRRLRGRTTHDAPTLRIERN
jgi:uncharacterized hydrophobic protein (TIGR00271 family)